MPVYFIRHGQTDWNRQRRFQSRSDIPLNATGINQARRVQAVLTQREVRFATAYCSPLARARVTAEIILEGSAVCVEADARLMEIALGEYEGRLETELSDELGAAFAAWRSALFTVAAPGGESLSEAMDRVRPLVQRWPDVAIRGDILIVAHQAINMAMKAVISDRCDHASLQAFRQDNDEIDIWDMTDAAQIKSIRV
ncbi:MAG: histidine phosphatase family protein [Gammaproteobacteria bacterium]|nr:histidine phosphatase family protein [Gammaproteobacteria bacterium]MDH3467526.1 histidine phosphatase family protein [Gammaproteobacteria bacterium]